MSSHLPGPLIEIYFYILPFFSHKSAGLTKSQILKIRGNFPGIKMEYAHKITCFRIYNKKYHIVAFLPCEIFLKN